MAISADPRMVAAAAVFLAAIEVVLDFTTWIQLNVSIIYGLPLVVAAAARSRRLVWYMAAVLIVSTFVVYALQIPAGAFQLHEPFFVNRVLAAASIVLTAALVHLLINAIDALDARRLELDRQRMEAEEASERKTRLLTSVSHDLRTPLTAIHLTADLISASAAAPGLQSKLPELAHGLRANALALSDMVADVLDVAQFESGRVSLRETEFALDEMLREQCQLLEPIASAAGLVLRLEAPAPALRVRADRVKLARVLRNLLKNAIQFTRRGAVTLSASLDASGALRIQVSDTGTGISREDLPRIFEEFGQLHAPLSRDTGWGLGLAICRRLIRLMDGDITAESQLEKGSVFTVVLPAARVLRTPTTATPALR